jgi:Protein of unknown function (DUF3489)
VTTAKHLATKEKTIMSNITVDAEKTPATNSQPETETKPKMSAKGARPAKKAKAVKKAKPPKKAAAKPAAERSNKKAEVIAMMKRAKGVTLTEIAEVTNWQKHTIRGFVSILGSKGGEKIESSKNAAGERVYKIEAIRYGEHWIIAPLRFGILPDEKGSGLPTGAAARPSTGIRL